MSKMHEMTPGSVMYRCPVCGFITKAPPGQEVECRVCAGSGKAYTSTPSKSGWTGRNCPVCKGTGIYDPSHDAGSCSACGGTGEEHISPKVAILRAERTLVNRIRAKHKGDSMATGRAARRQWQMPGDEPADAIESYVQSRLAAVPAAVTRLVNAYGIQVNEAQISAWFKNALEEG